MTVEDLLTTARAWLKAQGKSVDLVSMRTVTKRGREVHLFKGKSGNETVRFVAILEDDVFIRLEKITTTERKYLGRFAKTDLEAYRARQVLRKAQGKRVLRRKVRSFVPKTKRV